MTGAINLASTVSIPGTVADGLRGTAAVADTVTIEHPGGVIAVVLAALAATVIVLAPIGPRTTGRSLDEINPA